MTTFSFLSKILKRFYHYALILIYLILYAQPNAILRNRKGKVGELITLNSCSSLPISINQLIS